MAEKLTLIERHSLPKEILFYFKSSLLIILRSFKNVFLYKPKKFSVTNRLRDETVISFCETDLWNKDDNEQNWILTAGKVQNLRTAAKKLNGLEVPANTTFSFWKHIGNPGKSQGYVMGREIREGCIVPTVAGGLCQLSNALYDAAVKAGFEIIERHKHTSVIKGSLAEIDRDATVKWNYIDLRFRSQHPFRIEIDMNAEKLILKFRSASRNNSISDKPVKDFHPGAKLNDCYSCGNFECFKHPDGSVRKPGKALTTFIVDEKWTEYEDYLKKTAGPGDRFIVPFSARGILKINRYVWASANRKNTKAVSAMALYRSLYIRAFAKSKKNVFSMMLDLDRKVAKEMVKHIPVECTHLVISQNLLPFAWTEGVLGGRTFDVLMTRLPIEKLHERLDEACKKFPESPTLNDFRAPEELILAENAALTQSRYIITPHQEIADLFNNKSIRLNWNYPKVAPRFPAGNKVLFPASALGRKGAYEVRKLAKELNLTVKITGDATENNFFWEGIRIEKPKNNPFEDVQLVVYPAYVEHQPRFLLKAIAAGLPVIATTACGLSETDTVSIIPTGDYNALKQTVQKKLGENRKVFREVEISQINLSTQHATS